MGALCAGGGADLRPPAGRRGLPSGRNSEARLLALSRKATLPESRTNVELHGHLVDFHWPAEGVVAEVDGFAFHHARDRFENDRRRDADLQAAGIRVLRAVRALA